KKPSSAMRPIGGAWSILSIGSRLRRPDWPRKWRPARRPRRCSMPPSPRPNGPPRPTDYGRARPARRWPMPWRACARRGGTTPPMRSALGLPQPERRIGLSAHDFAAAFAAERVLLTRAEREGGAPTVPSRWLARLDALYDHDRESGRPPPEYIQRGRHSWLAW